MNKIISIKKKLFSLSIRIISWYIKHYLFKKDLPLVANFQLTHLCNLKCKMCNLWTDPQKNILDFNTYKSIIKNLKDMGCCYITLSGGEPLLINNILSYIVFAKRNIPFVNLVSNGYILDKKMAVALAESGLDSICISIDGFNKTHDEIRGKADSFNRAIEAINNLKEFSPKIKITVNTVISRWNIDEIIKLTKFIENLGVLHKFQPVYNHPVFNNQEAPKYNWQLHKEEIDKLKDIIKYLKTKDNISNSKYYLSSILGYFLNKNKTGLFKEKCKSVHFYCEIRDNSMLFPCIEGMHWQNGFNLENANFKEIYYSDEYKKTVKQLRNCKRCQEILPICYLEPKIVFPITSFIKYTILPSLWDR